MGFHFGSALIFVLVACVFLMGTLLIGRFVRPRRSGAGTAKGQVYECGEAPIGKAWFNFNPRFFLVGLVFLVFDVEVAFTYPVAVAFRRFVQMGQGAIAFFEVLVFVAVLVLALIYAFKRGDLEWLRSLKDAKSADAVGSDAPR